MVRSRGTLLAIQVATDGFRNLSGPFCVREPAPDHAPLRPTPFRPRPSWSWRTEIRACRRRSHRHPPAPGGSSPVRRRRGWEMGGHRCLRGLAFVPYRGCRGAGPGAVGGAARALARPAGDRRAMARGDALLLAASGASHPGGHSRQRSELLPFALETPGIPAGGVSVGGRGEVDGRGFVGKGVHRSRCLSVFPDEGRDCTWCGGCSNRSWGCYLSRAIEAGLMPCSGRWGATP